MQSMGVNSASKRIGRVRRARAFTLIELLVVIAIIAVLMGILMPALARVREQARQQSCGTRIRQHVLALTMYANENDTKLPIPTTTGYWLQDIARNVANFMLRTGMTKEIFYCPSNAPHQKYMDMFWLFSGGEWDGTKFTNNGYLVSGYCYLLQNSSGNRAQIRRYAKDTETKIWLKTVQEKRPAIRELVIDSIMGQPAPGEKYGRNFATITAGGIYSQTGGTVSERSSHLTGGGMPIGGNIGFLDGHTEWRKFEPDLDNGNAMPRAGDNPGFFW
ncbi:MAG: type II secretion system protein [Sedimentisphaerales bacterium]|nr:type II secretion system protein [Sedimentisphaerales bacterium]